tara:strand:- start:322 stop:579 length:258 start_codon:yes stop_codon:yes gene_type:complete
MKLFRFIKDLLRSYDQNKELLKNMERLDLMKELQRKDVCVSCDMATIYDKTTHISQRSHYVEGAGQLCKECFNKIYNIKETTYEI